MYECVSMETCVIAQEAPLFLRIAFACVLVIDTRRMTDLCEFVNACWVICRQNLAFTSEYQCTFISKESSMNIAAFVCGVPLSVVVTFHLYSLCKALASFTG